MNFSNVRFYANRTSKFPLIVAMHTRDRASHGARLSESLTRFKLAHAVCEVDSVHSSTSIRGNLNSRFAKPLFIKFWLTRQRKPVLYVDADMVFVSFPTEIFQASTRGVRLAVFNWLSSEDNQTLFPEGNSMNYGGRSCIEISDQLYVKGFSVDYVSTEQIIVSGAVQFWGDSPTSLALLESWAATVAANPKSRDDHSLDYAFNNFPDRANLNFFSLPRAYCRYAWWPHITPVIDHPDLPALNMPWQPLAPEYLSKRVHSQLLGPRNPTPQSSNSPSA